MNDRSREINDVAPTSLSHLVGQKSVVDQVRVALDAAFEDGRRMDSCLLVGPPGVGKSALAGIIASEMATEYHEVLGQSIAKPSDLNAVLLQGLVALAHVVLVADQSHGAGQPAVQRKGVGHVDERRLAAEVQYLVLVEGDVAAAGGVVSVGLIASSRLED